MNDAIPLAMNIQQQYQQAEWLYQQQQYQPALALLQQLQKEVPHFAPIYLLQGKIISHQSPQQALAYFEQAVSLDDNLENHFALLHCKQELASTSVEMLNLVREYSDLLLIYPNNPMIYHNRSDLLKKLGLYELALQDEERCLQFVPDYALGHCNKAFILNALGHYQQGWAEYEWRWRTGLAMFKQPSWPIEPWQGQPIGQQKLLIYAEQGLGDNIQFARYAILAQQLGLNIVVINHRPVQNLINFNLARLGINTVPNGSAIDNLSYYVSMMSLPHYFATQLDSIPCPDGYIIAEPSFKQKWQQIIARTSHSNKLKVGLVWAGSNKHNRDRFRSLDFTTLSCLFELDCEFHCLQKQVSEQDQQIAQQYPNLHLWHQQIDDFSDTAGIIEQLDLVISVDTSVAHLSASMAKPTWILLNAYADFRWLLHRTDSPWYKTALLFRQDFDQPWSVLIQQVKQQLQLKLQETGHG